MLDMPYEDLLRDLKGNVMMHKNKPVFVEDIAADGTVRIFDLLTQRSSYTKFSLDEFQAPRRLGFINTKGSVIYGYRSPIRKFYMGLTNKNVKVTYVGVHYPYGRAETRDRIYAMTHPEIGDALMNKYPTFKEAVETVKKFRGAVAFDKQFALSSDGLVFYKTEAVGTWKGTPSHVSEINWSEDNKHLSLLLDNNHEKTLRDFRPTRSQG